MTHVEELLPKRADVKGLPHRRWPSPRLAPSRSIQPPSAMRIQLPLNSSAVTRSPTNLQPRDRAFVSAASRTKTYLVAGRNLLHLRKPLAGRDVQEASSHSPELLCKTSSVDLE